MKPTLKSRVFLIPLLILFFSCKKDSSKIDQNLIYQKLSIEYDINTDITSISASFREEKSNGKLLELSDGSTVTINGKSPKTSGAIYEISEPGNIGSISIVFKDTEGKSYSNILELPSYISLSNKVYVEKSKNMNWTFYGDSLKANEQVDIYLTNYNDDTQSSTISTNTLGTSSVYVPASKLSSLPDGQTKVVVKKIKTITSGNFTSVGGEIEATYTGYNDFISLF